MLLLYSVIILRNINRVLNADMTDVPFHPMTRYEQLIFDLKGFLVIPSVLSETEIQTVRNHMDNYKRDPNSLPEPYRAPIAGPAEFLIDHPRVMGILQTLIDPDRERIRLESVFTSARSIDDSEPWRPHVGGTNVLPSFSYRHHNGRIYSAMTRVVWELNEVVKGKGGTRLVPARTKPTPLRCTRATGRKKPTTQIPASGEPTTARPAARSSSRRQYVTPAAPGSTQTTPAAPSSLPTTT